MIDTTPRMEDRTAALRCWMAVERLRQAARALLEDDYDVASASYCNGVRLTNAEWLKEEPAHAALCIEVRRALNELDRVFPPQSQSEGVK